VADAIDVGLDAFDDGAGTAGSIVDAAGLRVDVADASDGVRVLIAGPPSATAAQLSMCGTTVMVATGTDATLECGSIHVGVSTGSVTVVIASGRTVTVGAASSATIAFTPDGGFTVRDVTGSGVVVMIGSISTPVAAGSTASFPVAPPKPVYRFVGFSAPVSNTSANNVNSGQNVPLKWQLLDTAGRPVANLTSATIRLTPCGGGQVASVVTFTRTTGLQSQGNGKYQIDWKTANSFAKSCKVLQLDLGEATTHDAVFNFTK
jgi:hypothetical protein